MLRMPGANLGRKAARSRLYLRLMKNTACCQEKRRDSNAGNNAGRSTVVSQGHGTADNAEGAEGEEVEPPQDSIGRVADEDVEDWDGEDDIYDQLGR